jgi:hypothetical protein
MCQVLDNIFAVICGSGLKQIIYTSLIKWLHIFYFLAALPKCRNAFRYVSHAKAVSDETPCLPVLTRLFTHPSKAKWITSLHLLQLEGKKGIRWTVAIFIKTTDPFGLFRVTVQVYCENCTKGIAQYAGKKVF